jgi:hypothetical protein
MPFRQAVCSNTKAVCSISQVVRTYRKDVRGRSRAGLSQPSSVFSRRKACLWLPEAEDSVRAGRCSALARGRGVSEVVRPFLATGARLRKTESGMRTDRCKGTKVNRLASSSLGIGRQVVPGGPVVAVGRSPVDRSRDRWIDGSMDRWATTTDRPRSIDHDQSTSTRAAGPPRRVCAMARSRRRPAERAPRSCAGAPRTFARAGSGS